MNDRRNDIDFTRTHEAYWDSDDVIRHRLRRAHAEAIRRYHLAVVRDAVLILLAVFVLVAASTTGFAS